MHSYIVTKSVFDTMLCVYKQLKHTLVIILKNCKLNSECYKQTYINCVVYVYDLVYQFCVVNSSSQVSLLGDGLGERRANRVSNSRKSR